MNKKAFIFILILLAVPFVISQEYPNYYDSYVNDFAKIFSVGQVGELRAVLEHLRVNTTAEVVVVTVDSIAPLDVRQYGIELATKWKIGKADKSNGLLILYAVKENKIGVEVGYGLEGILNDAKVGRMLDEYYVPSRNAGNVTLGIVSFTNEIVKVLEQNKEEIISKRGDKKFSSGEISSAILWLVICFLIIIIIKAIAYPFSNRKNKGFGDFWVFVLLNTLLNNRRSGGGSGGFSGGGGFGGGGFGGGGASR